MSELHVQAPISVSITMPAGGGLSDQVLYVHGCGVLDVQAGAGVDVIVEVAAGWCADKTDAVPIAIAARSPTVGGSWRFGTRKPGGTTYRIRAKLAAPGAAVEFNVVAG